MRGRMVRALLVARALASCRVGRSSAWFESRPGHTWPSAWHNDCSRETLQYRCNLRRSPVVLPLPSHRNNFVEDQVRAVSSTPYWPNLSPGDRRRHSKGNSCVVQLHCPCVGNSVVKKNVLESSPFWSSRRHGPCTLTAYFCCLLRLGFWCWSRQSERILD